MSCPTPAMGRPSIVIDSNRFAEPATEIMHLSGPVSTVNARASFVTLTEPETADWPADNSIGVATAAGTTVAKPLHLSDPSGQKASGQDCRGSCLPLELS